MVERPGSLPEFEARFPDEAACARWLAVREALARRVPLPRPWLRARQGLGAGSRHAADRMRALPPADLGDRRDGPAPQPPPAQALLPGGLARGAGAERALPHTAAAARGRAWAAAGRARAPSHLALKL